MSRGRGAWGKAPEDTWACRRGKKACGAAVAPSLGRCSSGVIAGASHPPGLVVSVWLDFGRDIHHEACCCSPIALSGECLYRLREGHSPRGGGGAREARPEDAWGVTARDGARQAARGRAWGATAPGAVALGGTDERTLGVAPLGPAQSRSTQLVIARPGATGG